jgi:hypothetical protein
MQYYLKYGARLFQVAIRLSILGFWVGILAVGSTEPNTYSRVNVSWHWARSPMTCSPGRYQRVQSKLIYEASKPNPRPDAIYARRSQRNR